MGMVSKESVNRIELPAELLDEYSRLKIKSLEDKIAWLEAENAAATDRVHYLERSKKEGARWKPELRKEVKKVATSLVRLLDESDWADMPAWYKEV